MKRVFIIWLVLSSAAATAIVWRSEAVSRLVTAPHRGDSWLDGGDLWAALVAAGVVGMQDDRLILPPEDQALQEMAQARDGGRPWPPEDAAARQRLSLLEQLFDPRNRQGEAVIRAVRDYNHSRMLVAVRDDREGAAQAPIQVGERPSRWQAFDLRGRALEPAPASMPEVFAFLNGRQPAPAGMGDWLTLLAPALPLTERVRLSTTLAAGHAGHLTVQVAGRLDLATSRLPGKAQVTWRCRQRSCDAASAQGAALTMIDIPPGEQSLVLMLSPLAHDGEVVVPDMHLTCATPCQGLPHWTPRIRPGDPPPKAGEHIDSADGIPLWQDGRATAQALDLNMLPILGGDDAHDWTLAGRLAHRPDRSAPAHLRISVDTAAQRAAQQALEQMIASKFPDNRRDDDDYRDRRRAAMVVINALTGDIVAAAQYPRTPTNLSAWDYAAMASGDPARDLSVPLGWYTMPWFFPGSIAKIPLDLAVLKTAEHDPAMARAVAGCAPLSDGTLPCLGGISVHQKNILLPGQKCGPQGCGIYNFRSNSGIETLQKASGMPMRSAACAGGPIPVATSLGMAQAVAVSSNVAHVKYAWMLDGKPAVAYDRGARNRRHRVAAELPDLEGSALVDMNRQLGFFDRVDLAGPLADHLAPAGVRGTLRTDAAHSELLVLSLPEAKARRIEGGAVDILAQSSIGQHQQANALAYARAAAAVGTGFLPHPRLVLAFNNQTSPPQTTPLEITDLEPLRRGMKAVTEVPQGTASKAFGGPDSGNGVRLDPASVWLRKARCQVWGKTGSGTISKNPDLTTGWFMAFVGAGIAHPAPLAVACVVSPIHGGVTHDRSEPTRTGGATCAPAVADFLYRLGGRPASGD